MGTRFGSDLRIVFWDEHRELCSLWATVYPPYKVGQRIFIKDIGETIARGYKITMLHNYVTYDTECGRILELHVSLKAVR